HKQPSAALLGVISMDDDAERVDSVAIYENIELHEIARAEADEVIVHRAVALREALQLVVEIVNYFRERNLVLKNDARRADVFGFLVSPSAVLAELHDRADALAGQD